MQNNLQQEELLQGSDAWLAKRKQHVTGSEAAVVMGLSPWQTPLQLWEYKMDMRPPPFVSPQMIEGNEMEPAARYEYELQTGHLMMPSVLVSDIDTFAMASLDGINIEQDRILEIKCGKASYREAEKGKIPDYYNAQMQHCMHVANVDVCDYWAWRPDKEPIMITVKRDLKFCAKLMKVEEAFYKNMLKKTPPEATDSDVLFISDKDHAFRKAEIEWSIVDKEIKELENLRDIYRKELLEASGESSCEGVHCRVRRYFRKGNIQYAKIPELKEVDLEQHRSKGSHQFRLTVIENEWE